MTQAPTRIHTPLEKMLQSFPKAYDKGNGWWTHDNNPRFDFREEENGVIRIKSWTGRDAPTILAMGDPPLKLSDLYPQGSFKPTYREPQFDLLSLSDYLGLDWKFLYHLGYRDGYTYKNKMGRRSVCVKIGGYCTPDGSEHSKVKVRLSTQGKVRFLWDQNTPGEPIPCGLHTLDDACRAGYLILGEGESDYATMRFHGFPFLGMSGADSHKHLDVSFLYAIPRIYILEEPDQAKKNTETGQGFYTNMRSHLRENGYTGEIFSIRFQLATQHKDPSNLHKSIVRFCQLTDEQQFTAAVKEQFAERMSKAFQLAIPEGNTGLETQEESQEVEPPVITEQDMLSWIKELLTVDASVLSPAHKVTLMVIMLYSTIWHEKGEFWWKVEAAHLAPFAGMKPKAFLKHLAYLANNIGIFEKRHIKIWSTPDDSPNPEIRRTELYIKPARSQQTLFSYPRTFHVVEGAEERKHGGTRTPKPRCKACQSENVDVYEATFCHDCKHLHYEPKNNAPTVEDEIVPEEEPTEPVESTAVALPLENTTDAPKMSPPVVFDEREEENTPDIPNLGTITPIYKDTQDAPTSSILASPTKNTTDAPKMSPPVVFQTSSHICHVDHSRKGRDGLLMYCSHCDDLAKGWADRVPYCPKHWQSRKQVQA